MIGVSRYIIERTAELFGRKTFGVYSAEMDHPCWPKTSCYTTVIVGAAGCQSIEEARR